MIDNLFLKGIDSPHGKTYQGHAVHLRAMRPLLATANAETAKSMSKSEMQVPLLGPPPSNKINKNSS